MAVRIKTMGDLFSLLIAGSHLVQTRRARWPGDTPRDRYHVQSGAESIAVPQGLAIAAIRTGRLTQIERPEHGPAWTLTDNQAMRDQR